MVMSFLFMVMLAVIVFLVVVVSGHLFSMVMEMCGLGSCFRGVASAGGHEGHIAGCQQINELFHGMSIFLLSIIYNALWRSLGLRLREAKRDLHRKLCEQIGRPERMGDYQIIDTDGDGSQHMAASSDAMRTESGIFCLIGQRE